MTSMLLTSRTWSVAFWVMATAVSELDPVGGGHHFLGFHIGLVDAAHGDGIAPEDEGKKMSQFFVVSLIGMLINVTIATIVVTYLQIPINNILQLPFLTPTLWGTIGALCGTTIGLFWNF